LIRKKYDNLSVQGNKLLNSFAEFLKSDDIRLNAEIEDGIIKCKLWEFSFIIRYETYLSKELSGFTNGKINLYLIQKKLTRKNLKF